MCDVLNTNEPRAKPHAIDLGIGMQLTNIARDVFEDAKMGRRYLPGSWVDNMTPQQILEASKNPNSHEALLYHRSGSSIAFSCRGILCKWASWVGLPPCTCTLLSIGVAAKVYRQIGIQLLEFKRLLVWSTTGHVEGEQGLLHCTSLTEFLSSLPIPVDRTTPASTRLHHSTRIKVGLGDEDRHSRRWYRCNDARISIRRIA